nr:FeoC-like transcriptional regulator [uncultured Holophaga sp.]
MILGEIKNYLKERHQATLADLAYRFRTDPSAMEGMLEPWIHKGRLTRTLLTGACGSTKSGCSCGQTCGNDKILYEWID